MTAGLACLDRRFDFRRSWARCVPSPITLRCHRFSLRSLKSCGRLQGNEILRGGLRLRSRRDDGALAAFQHGQATRKICSSIIAWIVCHSQVGAQERCCELRDLSYIHGSISLQGKARVFMTGSAGQSSTVWWRRADSSSDEKAS